MVRRKRLVTRSGAISGMRWKCTFRENQVRVESVYCTSKRATSTKPVVDGVDELLGPLSPG